MTPRRALWALIALSALFRLIWAASLGPGNDEAYHYLFTTHPDWSYFDHPPMLALIESLGIAVSGGVVTPVSLRLGFILLFAGSTLLMARLGARIDSDWAGFYAAFALNISAYYTAAAGAFALPDGPLLFFWLLTLNFLIEAIDSPDRLRLWIGVGLAWGAALLSKYHAIFLPAGMVLYLLIEPNKRRLLFKFGPYLAVLVGLVGFSPVLYWNASHHWASFAFQSARAIGESGFRPDALLAAIFLPGLYLFPWIWIGLLWALGRKLSHFRSAETRPVERFLLCESIVPLLLFLAVACTRPVLPHWTLVGFLPLFPLLGKTFESLSIASPTRFRYRTILLATLPLLAAGTLLLEARTGWLQKGRPGGLGILTAGQDPTSDLVGWDTIAKELQRRGLLDRPDTFLFTSTWYHSGQLAFSTRNSKTPVLCYHPWDSRSFGFWSEPSQWVGREGILVSINNRPSEPGCYDNWFQEIEPIGSFEVDRKGAAVRTVRLFRCRNQTEPFPFDDFGRSIHPRSRNQASSKLAKTAFEPDTPSDLAQTTKRTKAFRDKSVR